MFALIVLKNLRNCRPNMFFLSEFTFLSNGFKFKMPLDGADLHIKQVSARVAMGTKSIFVLVANQTFYCDILLMRQ